MIQQALYFRPIRSGASQPTQLNPLLTEKFNHVFFEVSQEEEKAPVGSMKRAGDFEKLPWSRSKGNSVSADDGETRESDCQASEYQERFTRRNASWRRMLISQPPTRHIGYFEINIWKCDALPFRAGLVPPRSKGPGVSWFRVTWEKCKGQMLSETAQSHCESLLKRTGILVEFQHTNDRLQVPRDPPNADAVQKFDAQFKSQDFQHPDFQHLEEHKHHGELVCLPSATYTIPQ
ncbi:hypothetical protein RJ55_05124 [Drechmeria coniospora]|nr:hypothetical protein RJ55_05124 [Drechmeria coniospora]